MKVLSVTCTPKPAISLPANTPILLGRSHEIPADSDDSRRQLFEEAVLATMRQHHPGYLKLDGRSIRLAINRAFVRFLLERTRGNQARAAELAGFNRNTLRTLIRRFSIDWQEYLDGRTPTGRPSGQANQ